MKNQGLTQAQREALIDLLVAGMYSDAHLATAEDERIQRMVASFGIQDEYDRQQFLDAAISRARRRTQAKGTLAPFVAQIATTFDTPELRRKAFVALNEIIGSDQRVTEEEKRFLALVSETFGVS